MGKIVQNKDIVILGASSYIGRNLCSSLVNKGYNVTAVVRHNVYDIHECIKVIECDILHHGEDLSNLIDKCDVCIMLCWEGTKKKDNNSRIVNENSAKALFEVYKELYAKFSQAMFIQAGSAAEYGNHFGVVDEESVCNPVTEYGKGKWLFSKLAVEHALNNNVNFIELRLHSVWGPDDNNSKMINYVISELRLGNSVKMSSDCSQMWNFLSVNMFCDIVLRIISIKKLDSEIYNVGARYSRPLKEYLNKIQEIIGSENSAEIMYGTDSAENAYSFVYDCSKLWNELKYEPEDDFEELVVSMK